MQYTLFWTACIFYLINEELELASMKRMQVASS